MSATIHRTPARGLANLRRLTATPRPAERCELCAAVVGGEHQHLVDPEARRLLCVCDACAILFDSAGVTRYRRVPRDVRALERSAIDDVVWAALGIPIGLAFFFRSSNSNTVTAVYPSPGGPAEITMEEEFETVRSLAPDVEALLVNRLRGARESFVVPIDECYKLNGVIRRHWTGFSGGDEVWEHIGGLFEALRRRARPARSSESA